jgi:ElaB/YqjD/DUF883 family membrane-anchored ribosome-binding protein
MSSCMRVTRIFRMKQDIEKISAGIDKLLAEAEILVQALADDTGEKLDGAREMGREKLQRICGHLRNARSEVVEGARKVDGAVHSHPWEALAATAIVGFLAGLLVRRR